MLKHLMSLAALASVATAPAIAQAAPLAAAAAPAAIQDGGGAETDRESTVGYVALAFIVVIGIFVALGISDEDSSASP
jgi:hypothetical protein